MTKSVGPIFEHACHEGNYGVTNTLAGARLGGQEGGRSRREEDLELTEVSRNKERSHANAKHAGSRRSASAW